MKRLLSTCLVIAVLALPDIAGAQMPLAASGPNLFRPVWQIAPGRAEVSQPPAAKRATPHKSNRRIVVGAVAGFAVGVVLGSSVGREMCLNSSRTKCRVIGGGVGAVTGVLIARR